MKILYANMILIIGYADGIVMNKVVGETTTESTYINGDVRDAKYIKVQVNVMI